MREIFCYEVYWKAYDTYFHGYVRAGSEKSAREIARKHLFSDAKIEGAYRVDESRITPQSVTLNFANTNEYTLFG